MTKTIRDEYKLDLATPDAVDDQIIKEMTCILESLGRQRGEEAEALFRHMGALEATKAAITSIEKHILSINNRKHMRKLSPTIKEPDARDESEITSQSSSGGVKTDAAPSAPDVPAQ